MSEPSFHIENYELGPVLGEGSMAVVYRARQLRPAVRDVAVKVMRPEYVGGQFLARFAREGEVLAQLSHSSIATFFDAGRTDEGSPYLAMEYVEGEPITSYCDRNHLTLRNRLSLFIDCCHAVQHAHQHGVLHRDLKPSNILVVEEEGRRIPKIIDFGLAKALESDASFDPLKTQPGVYLGTPFYMSPEQYGVTRAPADSRVDVYALGVLLYELLSGRLPIDLQEFEKLNPAQARALLLEKKIPPPSRRASEAPDIDDIAARRGVSRRKLVRLLRDDLDLITMRAMERDRDRRYSTVAALAEDLERCQDGRPISIRPFSLVYLLRKWTAQHKPVATTAAVAVLLLVAAAVGLAVLYGRAVVAEDAARAEAKRATDLSSFILRTFARSESSEETSSPEILENLDAARQELLTTADQPGATDRVGALGEAYRQAGYLDRARPLLEAALQGEREEYGDDDVRVGFRLVALGTLEMDLETEDRDVARADSLFSAGLRIVDRPETDPLRRSEALQAYARLLTTLGRFEPAETYYRRTIELLIQTLGKDSQQVARARIDYGTMYNKWQKPAAGLAQLDSALDVLENLLGPTHAEVARGLANKGVSLCKLERFEEALPILNRAADIQREKSPGSLRLAQTLNNLGNCLWSLQQGDLALKTYVQSLQIKEAHLGKRDVRTISTRLSIADLLAENGRVDEAKDIYREAIEILETKRGADFIQLAVPYYNLADLHEQLGEMEAAEAAFERVLEIDRVNGGDDETVMEDYRNCARVLKKLGRETDAMRMTAEAERIETASHQTDEE